MKTLLSFLGSFTAAALILTSCNKDAAQQVTPDAQRSGTAARPNPVGNKKVYDKNITDVREDPCVPGDSYCKDIVVSAPRPRAADIFVILATGTPGTLKGLYDSGVMITYMAGLKSDTGFKELITRGAYSRMIDNKDGRKVFAFGTSPDVSLGAETPVVSIRY